MEFQLAPELWWTTSPKQNDLLPLLSPKAKQQQGGRTGVPSRTDTDHVSRNSSFQKATHEGNDEDLGGTNGDAELPFHQPRTLKEQRKEFSTK
jgi:hypothetical protein